MTKREEKRRFKETYLDGTNDTKYIKVITDLEEINKILEYIYSQTVVLRGRPREKACLTQCSYLQWLDDRIIITCAGYDGSLRRREYGFWLNDKVESMIGGFEVFEELQSIDKQPHHSRMAKTPEQKAIMEELLATYTVRENGKLKSKHVYASRDLIIKPNLDKGEKHIEPLLYCYDRNSAYAAIARKIDADWWHPMWDVDEVPEGWVGFNPDKQRPMVHAGEPARIAFKLIPSPYTEWIDRVYQEKENAPKNSLERADAKQKLVAGFGAYENHNMFYRTLIVQTLREQMQELVDKDTYYVNTDCIYSLKPRPDLEIGTGIGQWKLQHTGAVRFPSAEFLYPSGKVKEAKFKSHKLKYTLDILEHKIKKITRSKEQCTISQETQLQETKSSARISSLSETISRLSTKYTVQGWEKQE